MCSAQFPCNPETEWIEAMQDGYARTMAGLVARAVLAPLT
jgi:hypothetical protein